MKQKKREGISVLCTVCLWFFLFGVLSRVPFVQKEGNAPENTVLKITVTNSVFALTHQTPVEMPKNAPRKETAAETKAAGGSAQKYNALPPKDSAQGSSTPVFTDAPPHDESPAGTGKGAAVSERQPYSSMPTTGTSADAGTATAAPATALRENEDSAIQNNTGQKDGIFSLSAGRSLLEPAEPALHISKRAAAFIKEEYTVEVHFFVAPDGHVQAKSIQFVPSVLPLAVTSELKAQIARWHFSPIEGDAEEARFLYTIRTGT